MPSNPSFPTPDGLDESGSARFFFNILDAIADPVFVKNEAHCFVTVNDAFCTFVGRTREALIGKADDAFVLPAEVAVYWEVDEMVLREGREITNEETYTDPAGNVHAMATKKSRYVDDVGRHYIVGVIHDLTERFAQERLIHEQLERLKQLDRMKDQFVSMLSHELRTPIHAILGSATILDDDLVGPITEEQRQYVQRIIGGTEGLLNLVNDLLDLSLIQSGQFVISPRRISVGEVISGVVTNLLPLAAERQQTLLEDVPVDLPDANADEQRVGQVLANLVGNAIKFSPLGTDIIVRAVGEGTAVRCEVIDRGCGIELEDLPRLFQRFAQLNPGNTRATRGSGLGLSISKSLVEAHGGTIGVTSTPGEGSTFWFTLPGL